jgi:NADPH-dependent curcumin reductase CurA
MTSTASTAAAPREWRLAARPTGWPTPEDFELATSVLPELADGQIRVRNEVLSVDPYMRGRMSAAKSYAAPYVLGEAMTGGAVGVVEESRAEGFAPGDHVLHGLGWREVAVTDAGGARVVDVAAAPASAYLGVLGMTGLTAYVGLNRIAEIQEGDVVFISGAAGAVGGAAGQIAKVLGASRVMGSAGSAAKVRHLTEDLGFDAAFNYRDRPVAEALRQVAAEGIDVYFDNVGGDHLEAAIGALNRNGRVALCGAISVYNATEPPAGIRNLALAIGKRLTLRGFIVSDHFDRLPDLHAEIGPAVRDGRVTFRETIVEGLDQAPQAFIDLLRGGNVGKMLVKL